MGSYFFDKSKSVLKSTDHDLTNTIVHPVSLEKIPCEKTRAPDKRGVLRIIRK